MATIYRGWISGRQKEAELLTSIGIKLGPWDPKEEVWSPCDVPVDAMEKLDPRWGQFIWGFESVEV